MKMITFAIATLACVSVGAASAASYVVTCHASCSPTNASNPVIVALAVQAAQDNNAVVNDNVGVQYLNPGPPCQFARVANFVVIDAPVLNSGDIAYDFTQCVN